MRLTPRAFLHVVAATVAALHGRAVSVGRLLIAARSRSAAKARSQMTNTLTLTAATGAQSKVMANGRVAVFLEGRMVSGARARLGNVVSYLSARSRATLRSGTAPTGVVSIRARGKAASFARGVMAGAFVVAPNYYFTAWLRKLFFGAQRDSLWSTAQVPKTSFTIALVTTWPSARVPRASYTISVPRNHMPYTNELPDFDAAVSSDSVVAPGTVVTVPIDFGPYLSQINSDDPVTLIGTPVVTCRAVAGGPDATPQARVLNDPVIGTAPPPHGSGYVNGAVFVQIGSAVASTEYELQTSCGQSNGDTATARTRWKCV